MNQFIAYFLNLSGDLLAGLHPQLYDLPDIFLENAQDSVAGLEIDFSLREKIRAREQEQQNGKT